MKNNEDHQIELALLHLVLSSSNPVCGEYSKVKVLEPMSFDSVRGAKEFENFMWDLEHCFATAHVPKADKLTIAVRYFRRMQFCGGGQRMDKLKRLKQVGPIQKYVKEFTSVLLDIQNMQKAQDLPRVIVATDALIDIQSTSATTDLTPSSKMKQKEKG
ncbi:hypothetical protein KY289_030318 [Solanum tuberosum]|nr:hypothetical protein KY289_030318 [Solanum tuberosum]